MQGGAGGMGHPKFGGVGGRGGRVFVEAKEGKLSWLLVLIRIFNIFVICFLIVTQLKYIARSKAYAEVIEEKDYSVQYYIYPMAKLSVYKSTNT